MAKRKKLTGSPQHVVQQEGSSAAARRIRKAQSETDKKLMLLLAEHIQDVRKKRAVYTKDIAADIGVTRSALAQMENGRSHFSAVTLYRLASALRCDMNELFPEVQEVISVSESDAAKVAKLNEEAAALLKAVFPKK